MCLSSSGCSGLPGTPASSFAVFPASGLPGTPASSFAAFPASGLPGTPASSFAVFPASGLPGTPASTFAVFPASGLPGTPASTFGSTFSSQSPSILQKKSSAHLKRSLHSPPTGTSTQAPCWQEDPVGQKRPRGCPTLH
ncbi:MAG: hypothetical protein GY822_29545 [Deltaproteobacteria bacterium]|nr:hypothetical protein [Deltaproteobacteria bacterium]